MAVFIFLLKSLCYFIFVRGKTSRKKMNNPHTSGKRGAARTAEILSCDNCGSLEVGDWLISEAGDSAHPLRFNVSDLQHPSSSCVDHIPNPIIGRNTGVE